MRILFCQTYYLPYISGLTTYTRRIAQGLKKRGHQITILTSQHQKSLLSKESTDAGLIIRLPVLFKFHKGVFCPGWLTTGLQQIKNHQVIILNLPQGESLLLAFMAKLFRKKIIIVYTCDVNLPHGLINRLAEKILFLNHYLAVKLADKIITYTQDYADHSPFLKYFRSKTIAILPPIPPINNINNYQSTINNQIYTIGFAGRIAAEKGLEYLLRVIPLIRKQIPHFQIKIVGPHKQVIGENKYLQKINRLIKNYSSFIEFIGEIKPEKMVDFYKQIDLLVLPSINSTEAFGMVQVEAMFYGTPVIATDLPGVRVPIQKTGMGIIVPIKNSKTIAKAIQEIYQNRQEYIKTPTKIKKIFNYQKTIDGYEAILKHLS